MTQSRREFNQLALSCVAAALPFSARAAAIKTEVRGVKLGITSGSLNPLPEAAGPEGKRKDRLDVIIEECLRMGVGNVELAAGFFGPAVRGGVFGQTPKQLNPEYVESREAQRKWRLNPASFEEYRTVRRRFDEAKINLFSISNTFADDVTDEEMDVMFRQMRELNVRTFQTNQTRVSMGPRLVPFAKKYKIFPSFHTHAETEDPNEIASTESLAKLLAMSENFRVCLDIGHFTAGNNDAVQYLSEHHKQITHIHVKDRKRNKGPNVAWGTGDTPIRECLTLIRDRRYPILCVIEREYQGTETAYEETRKDLEYMKRILLA